MIQLVCLVGEVFADHDAELESYNDMLKELNKRG